MNDRYPVRGNLNRAQNSAYGLLGPYFSAGLKWYSSYGSVCELETQILLAGDLGFIEKGELGTAKKDIAEIERMLKTLIKSL